MRHYVQYFDLNPENAAKWEKIKGAAYDALFKGLGPPSDTTKAISKWFDHTATPYYAKLDKLYTSIQTAPKLDQEAIYSEIRQVSDRYDALARKSGDPTPEEYSFAKKTPAQQRQVVAKWAGALDGTWLTAFQRRQVGYEGQDKAVTEYSNYSSNLNARMRQFANDHGIAVNTTAWDDLTKQRDQFLAHRAETLGVTDTVKEMNAPTYTRVGRALDLTGNNGWDRLVTDVHTINRIAAGLRGGDGVSMAGSTVEAQSLRDQFFKYAEDARQTDPALDKALNDIAVGLGKTTDTDLYDLLFFDKTF